MRRPKKSAVRRSIVLNNLTIFLNRHSETLSAIYKICFVLLVIIISYIAFLPNYNELPEFTSISDVLNHFFVFFVLSIFLDQGFRPKIRQAFLLLFLYGFFIEAVQYFLPNRVFDLMDIVVDMVGICIYYLGRSISRSA